MSLYKNVKAIQAASGKAKVELFNGLDPEEQAALQQYIKATLHPRVSLYQTLEDGSLRQPVNGLQLGGCPKRELPEALEYITEQAALGETRGKKGHMLIRRVRSRLPSDNCRELFDLFIDRNPKMGWGIKTVNKLWGDNFLPYSPYQRCSGAKEKLLAAIPWEQGAFSQLKSDGMFLNIFVNGTEIEFTTRDGNILESQSMENLVSDIDLFMAPLSLEQDAAYMVHGEALVYFNGVMLDRAKGNGKLNSIIQTGEDLPEGYEVKFVVWDIVPHEVYKNSKDKKSSVVFSEYPYEVRFAQVERLYNAACGELTHISLQESRRVFSIEEAMAHFQEMLERGEEGTIIKNPNALWYDGTSADMLKFKLEVDVDLVVVGLNPGDPNGKHKDTFGSIQCESSCGMLAVGVHGLSDELRAEIHANFELWNGSIIPVKSNGIQENEETEETGKVSLFLPRLGGERRLDKKEADDLATIRDIQAATIKNGGKTPKK